MGPCNVLRGETQSHTIQFPFSLMLVKRVPGVKRKSDHCKAKMDWPLVKAIDLQYGGTAFDILHRVIGDGLENIVDAAEVRKFKGHCSF